VSADFIYSPEGEMLCHIHWQIESVDGGNGQHLAGAETNDHSSVAGCRDTVAFSGVPVSRTLNDAASDVLFYGRLLSRKPMKTRR